MDDLTILAIFGLGALTVTVIFWRITSVFQAKYNAARARTAAATRARHAETPAAAADVGPWVKGLMEEFGIDEEVLFDDEMPEELERLMPLIRGFVKGGGLERILGSGGSGGAPGYEPGPNAPPLGGVGY